MDVMKGDYHASDLYKKMQDGATHKPNIEMIAMTTSMGEDEPSASFYKKICGSSRVGLPQHLNMSCLMTMDVAWNVGHPNVLGAPDRNNMVETLHELFNAVNLLMLCHTS